MIVHCAYDQLIGIDELKLHPKNRNEHPPEQIERLAKVLKYQGWRYAVNVSNQTGLVNSGHGRILAAKLNGWTQVPVKYQDFENEDQEYASLIADNAIASWAELDLAGVNFDIPALGPDFEIDMLGIENFVIDASGKTSDSKNEANKNKKLSDRFLVPPFSVLDTRQGYWQDRKREWLALGIQSELGRGDGDASPGGSPRPAADYSNKERGDGMGRAMNKKEGREAK